MSANDTSVSTEVPLDRVNTAWGMNEMSACCRGCMIDCMLWAICPPGGLWAYLRQVLESGQDPQGLHLPLCHVSLFDDRNDSSLDGGWVQSPKLEVTGWKQWPCSMLLLPLTEPHQHGYNIYKHGHLLLYIGVHVSKLVPSYSGPHT